MAYLVMKGFSDWFIKMLSMKCTLDIMVRCIIYCKLFDCSLILPSATYWVENLVPTRYFFVAVATT